MKALLQKSKNDGRLFQTMVEGKDPVFSDLVDKYMRLHPKDLTEDGKIMELDDGFTIKELKTAYDYLKEAAAAGDSKSNWLMAKIYQENRSFDRFSDILPYLKKAADEGSVEANYILACEYYFGDIVDRDLDIVLDCCAHLTVRNFDIGTVVYGALMNLKSEATNEFEGDRAVMYLNYGKMLLEGNCDSSDEERGLDYINKAASDENPAALFELGLIHCNGDYCQTDMGKSIEYFTRAAELEQCDSMLTLGFLYKGIQGVEEDLAKAAHYFTMAADREVPEAYYQLAKMIVDGDQSCELENGAIGLLVIAAKFGHEESAEVLKEMGIDYEWIDIGPVEGSDS